MYQNAGRSRQQVDWIACRQAQNHKRDKEQSHLFPSSPHKPQPRAACLVPVGSPAFPPLAEASKQQYVDAYIQIHDSPESVESRRTATQRECQKCRSAQVSKHTFTQSPLPTPSPRPRITNDKKTDVVLCCLGPSGGGRETRSLQRWPVSKQKQWHDGR